MVVRPLPFVVADILQHIGSDNLPQHERKVLWNKRARCRNIWNYPKVLVKEFP